MNSNYYRRRLFKSGLIILFILIFAVFSTYAIYHKFAKLREQDYDTGKMEVIFHEKVGNQIDIKQYNPVTDAVGLSSPAYTFTIENSTQSDVNYKIVIKENNDEELDCTCLDKKIPTELLKLSLRKDHQAPLAFVLAEYQDGVIYHDTLEAGAKEDYSIRIWAMNSKFVVDKTSHFHAKIEVIEEE